MTPSAAPTPTLESEVQSCEGELGRQMEVKRKIEKRNSKEKIAKKKVPRSKNKENKK